MEMKLNKVESENLYEEVVKRVESYSDYYTTVCAPIDTEYGDDCITFIARYCGGRNIYMEWDETWYVYSDGRISNSEGDSWESIEKFDY